MRKLLLSIILAASACVAFGNVARDHHFLASSVRLSVGNGATTWNASRPTGYGSVPGYAPAPLGFGGSLVQSSAWRGRWVNITGCINLGSRPYRPEIGAFESFDAAWNGGDPNGYTFCGGNPIDGFDADGRLAKTGANFVGGTIQGFGQGYFGTHATAPNTDSEYNGQQFGRNLAGSLATALTLKGGVDTGGGGVVMAGSLSLEAGSGGVATIVAGPGLVVGAELTLQGLAEIALGKIGLANYNNLTPLQPASNDSGGGGGGQDSSSGQQQPAAESTSPQQGGTPTQRANPAPQNAIDTLTHIENTGSAPSGFRGGTAFQNDGRGGGQLLPTADSTGNPITYKEWDVSPYQSGVNRGPQRIVTGSDGSAYYTGDHYTTFKKVK